MQPKESKSPELRFSEYSASWIEDELSNYVLEHRGGASLKPSDFVESSVYEVVPKKAIVKGCLLELSESEPTYCSEKFFKNNRNAVVNNSFLITTLRDLVPTAPSIGLIVCNPNENELLLAQGVYGFKISEGLMPGFLTNLSNKESYRRLMYKICVGSTQVHVRSSEFFNIKITLPCPEEQQKIADFLSVVDEKISLLKQRHNLMQQYKKGVMQQFFSQQIRFKDDNGHNFPDWKESRLGDHLEEYKQKTQHENEHEVLTSSRGGLIRQKDYFGINRITERSNKGFHIVPLNYITYRSRSDDRRFYFNVNELGITGIISTYYPVFKMKSGCNKFFIELSRYHRNIFGKYSVGTSQVVLSYNELCRIILYIPSGDEQKKIADFAEALDKKIDLSAKLIELTQTFKNGLLQQMFV